jgi:hypothetical protein
MIFPSDYKNQASAKFGESSQSVNAQTKAESDIHHLRMQVDRLFMISEALWEFIKKHHDLDESALFRQVMDIDARDGKIDGKSVPKPKNCPECNHILPREKPFCLYCGTIVIKEVFDR